MAQGVVQRGMVAANWDIGMSIVLYLQAEKPVCFHGKQTFLFYHSRNKRSFVNRTEKYDMTDLHNADS